MDQTTFDQCMKQMKEGDKDALRRIYEAYHTYLYTIILSIVREKEDAEDLTVECFLKLWKAADQYQPGNTHKAYLASIARNLALDHLRKQERSTLLTEAMGIEEKPDPVQSPEQRVVSELSFRDMMRALPQIEQQILALKLEGDLTFREIGEVLNLPMGTVTWKYRKALDALKKHPMVCQ